jgi:hypothetical protein
MKHTLLSLLVVGLSSFVFSSLGGAQTAAPTAADMELTKRLIGVWHESPSVGAGYAQRFRFFPDGRYTWQVSQSVCDARIRERSGRWRVRNGLLEVFASSQAVWVGGKIENDPICGGPAIVGATLTTQSIRQLDPSRWKLTSYRSASASSPYASLLWGDTRWYRLSSNPNDHK